MVSPHKEGRKRKPSIEPALNKHQGTLAITGQKPK